MSAAGEDIETREVKAGEILIVEELLPHTEPLHKVTIIPRGPSLGSTMWLPEEDKSPNRKAELVDSLTVSMGGRVAEELVSREGVALIAGAAEL